MLFTNSEPSLGGPVGPALAYGKIIRNTESARSLEYRVFEDVTATLADAGLPGVPFTDRIRCVPPSSASASSYSANRAA